MPLSGDGEGSRPDRGRFDSCRRQPDISMATRALNADHAPEGGLYMSTGNQEDIRTNEGAGQGGEPGENKTFTQAEVDAIIPGGFRVYSDETIEDVETGVNSFEGRIGYGDRSSRELKDLVQAGRFILKGSGRGFDDKVR